MTNTDHATVSPLPSDSPLYVERLADHQAWAGLQKMEYVLFVEPRQQGKTRLIHRLAARCQGCDYVFAYLDLANLDTLSEASWYDSLGRELLRLFTTVIADHFLSKLTGSTWFPFLCELAQIASSCRKRLVIALDDVGAIPDAWATDFFATIRSVYGHRGSMEYLRDLTFIIAGAQDPRDMIRDRSISGFFLSSRVPLGDFTPDEVQELVEHISATAVDRGLAERVHYWTAGQPYLCMKLYQYLTEIGDALNVQAVDAAVDRLFLEDMIHLPRIMEDLRNKPGLIDYLCRILTKPTRFSPALNPEHFRLAHVIGIISPDEDLFCQPRNRIYMRALSEAGLLDVNPHRLNSPPIGLPTSSKPNETIRILHLSDLHFDSGIDPLVCLQPLVADLRDRQGGFGLDRLDYLVISGDLTLRAIPEEFGKAYQFVSSLIAQFELRADCCIVVPGNHDLSWDEIVYDCKSKRHVDTSKPLDDRYKPQGEIYLVRDDERYPGRFRNFAQHFFRPLFGRMYPLAFEDQAMSYLFEDNAIQFIALNSCWQIDEWFTNRSGIHTSALARGLANADQKVVASRNTGGLTSDTHVLRIGVWHHPVTGNEKIQDDAFVGQLMRAGVGVCLHGHVHEERADLFNYLHPRSIHIVGAGSFGAAAKDRPESVPRLYNLLEVTSDHRTVRVHTRCRRKDGGPWQPWAIWPVSGSSGARSYYTIRLKAR